MFNAVNIFLFYDFQVSGCLLSFKINMLFTSYFRTFQKSGEILDFFFHLILRIFWKEKKLLEKSGIGSQNAKEECGRFQKL